MNDVAIGNGSEPECRTCEDWGTVVVLNGDGKPVEIACPDHVGSVAIPTHVSEAATWEAAG